MPQPYPPDMRERVRVRLTTTDDPVDAIAAGENIDPRTVERWAARYGWVRPGAKKRRRAGARREAGPKLAPRLIKPARAIHEGRGTVADLAALLGVTASTLARRARRERWARARGPLALPHDPEANDVDALDAALAGPGLDPAQVHRAIARAAGRAAIDALAGHDRAAERAAQTLTKLAGVTRILPAAPPRPEERHDDPRLGPATYAELDALVERIARRIEAYCAAEDAAAAVADAAAA